MNELLKEIRIILKWSLNKYNIRVRVGLVWLEIENTVRLLYT